MTRYFLTQFPVFSTNLTRARSDVVWTEPKGRLISHSRTTQRTDHSGLGRGESRHYVQGRGILAGHNGSPCHSQSVETELKEQKRGCYAVEKRLKDRYGAVAASFFPRQARRLQSGKKDWCACVSSRLTPPARGPERTSSGIYSSQGARRRQPLLDLGFGRAGRGRPPKRGARNRRSRLCEVRGWFVFCSYWA